MATFPTSSVRCHAKTTVVRTAVQDSPIENLGYSALNSRGACEHSQPAQGLVAIAAAWHTCGVAAVVLPGQRDVLFAQPLRAPAERAVTPCKLSHEESRQCSVDEAVDGDADRRRNRVQFLAPRQHASIVGAEHDT